MTLRSEQWLSDYQARMASMRSGVAVQVQEEPKAVRSRYAQGVRPDVGPMAVRSSWEANFCRYLKFQVDHGLILKWEYEPETFWFAAIKRGVCSYKPDFKIWPISGDPYFIELKGWMDPKSKTKLKRMAKYYPTVRVELVDQKAYAAIARTVSMLIPGWETQSPKPRIERLV